jgi:hypothetical protein
MIVILKYSYILYARHTHKWLWLIILTCCCFLYYWMYQSHSYYNSIILFLGALYMTDCLKFRQRISMDSSHLLLLSQSFFKKYFSLIICEILGPKLILLLSTCIITTIIWQSYMIVCLVLIYLIYSIFSLTLFYFLSRYNFLYFTIIPIIISIYVILFARMSINNELIKPSDEIDLLLMGNFISVILFEIGSLFAIGIISFLIIKRNIKKKPFIDYRILNNKLHNF